MLTALLLAPFKFYLEIRVISGGIALGDGFGNVLPVHVAQISSRINNVSNSPFHLLRLYNEAPRSVNQLNKYIEICTRYRVSTWTPYSSHRGDDSKADHKRNLE